ncbi:MAG: tetratricopeptide repeat protein, partial [Deltaproteobacteria bacterium]|nr:tetratricopeptide repeat protein [Deltaproteobacteria bacterium]
MKKSPHKDRPHVNLGLAYLNDRLYDDSLLEFEKALSVNPNNIEAMNNMGIVYSYIGKYQKAEEAFTESIALERKNPNAYN